MLPLKGTLLLLVANSLTRGISQSFPFSDSSVYFLFSRITSRNLQPWFYQAFRPLIKNHPLFYQKHLTNSKKFAAKPIDYILFQSTGGDFLLPCNPDGHSAYQDTFVSEFLKFYPNPFVLSKSTWNYIVQFWYLDLSLTDSIIKVKSHFHYCLVPYAQGNSSLHDTQRFPLRGYSRLGLPQGMLFLRLPPLNVCGFRFP